MSTYQKLTPTEQLIWPIYKTCLKNKLPNKHIIEQLEEKFETQMNLETLNKHIQNIRKKKQLTNSSPGRPR